MSKMNPQAERQLSTLPPVVRKEVAGKELSLIRIKKGTSEIYQLENGGAVLCTFSPWQFHVLNALFAFGGDQYATLLANVNERFGLELTQAHIDGLLEALREKQLFDGINAPNHPLTKPFCQAAAPTQSKPVAVAPQKKAEKAAIQEKTEGWPTWKLFNPTNFLKSARPTLSKGKYLLYPLPLFALSALLIVLLRSSLIIEDVTRLLGSFDVMEHIIFDLITVNILATATTASVAYLYGATVSSIVVVWYFNFIPRFMPILDDTGQLNRRQTIWLHAAPLLLCVGIFSVGLFLWYHGRAMEGFMPRFGLMLAWVAFFQFLITACPFYKSNGYQMMVVFLKEPMLREKAFKALLDKWNRNSYARVDRDALVIYALVCGAFTVSFSVIIFVCVFNWLNLSFGPTSILIIAGLIGGVYLKLRTKFKAISEAYQRNYKFERWRERVFPDEIADEVKKKQAPSFWTLKRALIASSLLVLIFPYAYQPSGQVVLLPITQQQLTSDIAGIVSAVNVEGGEFLEKGAVIASLSVNDHQAQLAILDAKLREQKAVIAQLKSSPTYEDVDVAEEKLEVNRVTANFSAEKCARQRKLYKAGSISLDALAAIETVCAVDAQQVAQAQAELDRIEAGVPREQIAVAEAALLPIMAQIALYDDKIKRSEFKMPFAGRVATLQLKDKQGRFLEPGEPIAVVEDESAFQLMLEVPETDLPYVSVGADVDVRTMAYPDKTFKGVVKTIDSNVEAKPYGKVVKIIVSLKNEEKILKSGMSGYAKVSGDTLLVVQVLTRAIYRFVTVELWAWIP